MSRNEADDLFLAASANSCQPVSIVNTTHQPRVAPTSEQRSLTVALLLLTSLLGCKKPVAEKGLIPPAAVMVVAARMGNVSSTIQSIGTVMPADESLVASSVSGLVVEMPVRDGQYVKQGEKLAQLRDVEVSIRVEEAQALLRQREQEFQRYESGNRQEEILKSESQVKAAEANSKYTSNRAERAAQSYEQNAITDDALDQSVYEAELAAQSVAEAQAEHQLMVAGFRPEEIEAARAARDAQQHIVTRLEDELARSRVEAPFDGYVTERHTDLGQWVEEGGGVVTLVRLEEVEIRVQVEEDVVQEIRVGRPIEVFVDALGKEPFAGEIRAIVPKSNWQQGSRSFPVVVRVTNRITDQQPHLKEGMLAHITFRGQSREVLLIDKDSIDRSSGRLMVFVVEPDNRVRSVEVQSGMSQGQFIEVVGDIQVGDQLVTEGVERLRPFQQVVILEPEPAETSKPEDNQQTTVKTGG